MKGKIAKKMSEWLARPTEDQNMNELADLALTQQDSKGLKWFRSRQIIPTVLTGYYDEDTGKFVLGRVQVDVENVSSNIVRDIIMTTQYSTTSVAANTLTCAAGHSYRIVAAGMSNSTRAPRWNLVITPNGGTATTLIDMAAGVGVQGEMEYSIGGGAAQVAAQTPQNEIWLNAGDTAIITDETFTAADAMRFFWLFEDYTL